MAQPTLSDVHVNRPLTEMSFAYSGTLETVADKVFPIVPVPNKTDSYYKYDKGNWFRLQAKRRAPGTESAGSGYTVTTDTYTCNVEALHKDVDDQIRANADPVFNLDAEAARFVTQQLLLKREYDFASTFFAGSLWTGSTTGSDITPGTKWNNASGTPINDILAQMDAVQKKTGSRPNKMVFGRAAWLAFINNADVLDRIKYTAGVANPAIANRALAAAVLGLDDVLIAGASYNTAIEGASDSMSFMFTEDSALLVHAAPAPGILTPSAGYVFSWNQYLAAPNGLRISRFREERLKSDRIEGEMAYAMEMVASDLGVLFAAVD